MQILKERVRAIIIKAAENEFQKLGFERTSMRIIAANANMTVGNLYRYYRNKEALFGAIVDKLVVELEKMQANTPKDPESLLPYLLGNFEKLQKNYSVEWLTLFGGNTGTKYRRIANEIHQTLKNSVADVLRKGGRHPDLAEPIASSIIFGLNNILQSRKSNKKICKLTNEFLDYMIGGLSHNVA